MRRSLALEFILYGILLVGLGLSVYLKAPDFGWITLLTSLGGGALSLLWGILVLGKYRRRWWIILAVTATMFVLMSQAVIAWLSVARGDEPSPMQLVAVLITLMLVFSCGILMNLLHGEGRQYCTETKSN
jgi:peptidoglycan/LPS O-acetylase OafA/YrhL